MAKNENNLMNEALALVEQNLTKKRGGSGKTTYLDRFVKCLLDEDGNPTEPKSRLQIISEISLDIAKESRATAIAAGEPVSEFNFAVEEDKAEFIEIAKKVKPMVAAAISNSNNSTALSYNEKYKEVWTIVKDKVEGTVSLKAIES